jgi:N-carbamoyl-L-amino-acid hydrolase
MLLKIDERRLQNDLETLAQIGRTTDGGVSRLAFSEADVQGRAWFRQRVAADGFAFKAEGAGNLSAVLPSADANARTLLFGSHLDTVPNGGRYDGALGVLAALEALRTIKDAGLQLPYHLEVISFTDEEGTTLPLGGSRAVAGILTEGDLDRARSRVDTFDAGLTRLGISRQSMLNARRDDIEAYVELHIEQGSYLEEAGVNIGVVTSIVGIRGYHLRFLGEAAHAGARPLHKRKDALWGAAAFILAARELVMRDFTPGVATVGEIGVQPGVSNIVPAEALLALEFRHSTLENLDLIEAALLDTARQAADTYALKLEIDAGGRHAPALMDERLMRAIETSADALGLSHMRQPSFAGHDGQSLNKIAPTAMLFVPSKDGVSHSPYEYTAPQDVKNGANVLLNTILALARR